MWHSSQLSSTQILSIQMPQVKLKGDLTLPHNASGLVIFAHGSGSSRLSPRNQFVAQQLQQSGLGTCLFDLLGPEEAAIDMETAQLRFDIPWLSQRLMDVTDWLLTQTELNLPLVTLAPALEPLLKSLNIFRPWFPEVDESIWPATF